jgi:AcrR family transcriptional regulator
MTRIANTEAAREYRSQLREEQAEATRTRILDATGRLMADGLATLSIPGVARAAGVSVPTIYRHFRTKRDLLASLYPHAARRIGLDTLPDPGSLDELRDWFRAYFERVDMFDDLDRAAMASPAADEARRVTMPSRLERIGRLADSIEPRLPKADRDRITRLLVILTASSSLRMWRAHLGATVDEAADDIDWIVRAAVAAATRRNEG